MQFFSAQSPEEYVNKAVALASKPEALTQIRATMRQRLAASPLCNYGLITKDIENAYRKMWHDYCCSKGVEITAIESHEDAAYKERRYSSRTIVENIISADKLYQAGERVKASKVAMKAFGKLSPDNNGEKPPKQLLQRYNADDLKSLIINFCMEIMAFSSYFSQEHYLRIYSKSQEINPSNPEIDLRIGLLIALQARLRNLKPEDNCIKLLEIVDSKLNSERSKAALALAKGELKELSLPYDLARIHLYPDLKNITTYVLLEQEDWFEKSDLSFFRSIIRPEDTVFDLGANVGPYSISAASRTSGKVIAIEPALQTFELLNRSASQFPNMTAIHTAISDKSGTAFLSHGGSSENFKLSGNNETQGEEVPLVTVDDIADEHDIESVDIIKMDVEGHELKALAGAKKIIANGSPIIFYEVKHGSDLHPELIEAFENLGFDSYYALPDAKTLVKHNKNIPMDEYLLNMIAIRPESLQRLEGLANIEQSQAEVLENMAAII
jgi:FkbM family methyltransferase